MQPKFSRRLNERDTYEASGPNAHIVFETKREDYKTTKIDTIALRRGREQDGEAVQIAIHITTRFESGRSRQEFGSFSLTAEQWAEIVDWLKVGRNADGSKFEKVEA